MPSTISVLLSLSRTCALNCFVALRELGPLPLTLHAVQEATGFPRPAVKIGLARLQAVGLAICTDSGWILAPAAKQLALPLDELSQPTVGLLQEDSPLQADDQLQAGTAPSDKAATSGPGTLGDQPTLLQAGEVIDAKPLCSHGTNLTSPPMSNSNMVESRHIIIDFKDSPNNESLGINNNLGQKSASDSEHGPPPPDKRTTKHVQQVLQALMRKSLPRPDGDDDLFPVELRLCVQRLEAINCPRKRAELAVARSPWPASTILDEIERWKAHKLSEHGRNLKASGFPYLVAARIEAGEPCPRYDDAIYAPSIGADPCVGLDPPEAGADPDPQPPCDDELPDPANPEADCPSVSCTISSLPAPSDADVKLWNAARARLQVELSKSIFDTWVRDLVLLSRDGDTLILGVPHAYARDWLENRLLGTIRSAVDHVANANPHQPPRHLALRLVIYSARTRTREASTSSPDLPPKTGA